MAWPPHLHVLCMHSDLDVCPSFVNFFMFSRGGSRGQQAGSCCHRLQQQRMQQNLYSVCASCSLLRFRLGFLRPNCCEISWPVYYTSRLQLQLEAAAATTIAACGDAAAAEQCCMLPHCGIAIGKCKWQMVWLVAHNCRVSLAYIHTHTHTPHTDARSLSE